MRQIGVGIVGAGSIAEIGHCPSIEALPNAKLAALCDNNQEILDRMQKKWNAEKIYTSYEAMLEDKNVEVVIVATPNRFHAQQAIDAMRAKKHVIVEKPFACTHNEAWKMVEVSKKEGVFLMAGTNQRFWEQNRIARDLMDKGYIGAPMMGRSSLHEGWGLYHEQLAFTQFRSDRSLQVRELCLIWERIVRTYLCFLWEAVQNVLWVLSKDWALRKNIQNWMTLSGLPSNLKMVLQV